MTKTKVATIGSGNIGTDLMIKILRLSDTLEMGAMVGIDPDSDGLARAERLKVPTTYEGVDGLIVLPNFDEIAIVFDATSAKAPSQTRPSSRHTARRSSTSRRLRSARSSYHRSISTSTSMQAPVTSTWSPVAGKRLSRWWPRYRR